MENSVLRKKQLVQLYILEALDNFCRNQELNYYLIGGTLLGAIRHGGFIPWDDDIDVAMIRSDYEKFCKIFPKNSDFVIQNITTTDNIYFKYFTKLRITGTDSDEENIKNLPIDKGIFIDIFPLDYSSHPESILLLVRRIMVDFLFAIRSTKLRTSRPKLVWKKVLKLPIFILSQVIPLKVVDYLISRIMTCGSESDQYLTYFGTYGHKKETMPRIVYGNPRELKFENRNYFVPHDFDYYLKKVYGDYTTLPPIEDRNPQHGGSSINFGKYDNIELVDGNILF